MTTVSAKKLVAERRLEISQLRSGWSKPPRKFCPEGTTTFEIKILPSLAGTFLAVDAKPSLERLGYCQPGDETPATPAGQPTATGIASRHNKLGLINMILIIYLGIFLAATGSYILCSSIRPVGILLRYHILPAVVAVVIWFLPLLAICGEAPILALPVFLFGIPISFACLIDQRRLWKQKSDVRKGQLYGYPMVLAALPCVILAVLICRMPEELPSTSKLISFLLQTLAWMAGVVIVAYVGAAVWYKLAYASESKTKP